MQILRQSTQAIVRVGPFVDVGDGFTPQTDITLGGDEAELFKNASVEVDISGRTWAAITGCRGWYDLTLTTDDTDTVGLLTVVMQDDSDCLPVFRDFQVIEETVYDEMFKAAATGVNAACDTALSDYGANTTAPPTANAIRDAIVDDATQIDASALNTLSGHDPGATIAKPGDAMTLAADQAVDVTKLNGDAQSLLDLKDFADSGYDPATDKITGCKVNDDMVGTDGANTTAPDNTNIVNIHNVVKSGGTGDCAAIMADTSELQTDDIPGTLSTNDTSVDAQLAAIKAETVLIVGDTNELQVDDIPGKLSDLQTHGDSTWPTATSVTVSDKTGFSLSTAGVLAIWHQLLAAIVTADTIGKKLKDWVVGQVTGTDNIDFSTSQKTSLNAATPDLSAITGDKASYKADVTNLDAAVSTRSSHDAAAVKTAIEAVGSNLALIMADTSELQTDDIPTKIAAVQTEVDKIDAVDTVVDSINVLIDQSLSTTESNIITEVDANETKIDAVDTVVDFIKDVTEGDAEIDTGATPWQLVITKKGTATELVRKDLKDKDGNNITGISTVIGQHKEP